MDYESLLAMISEQYNELLGENLVGIYVHGSIASGCFNRDKSDIDFIVIVNNTVSKQIKLQLLQILEDIRGQAPKKGFEMSVVRGECCKNFMYPTPYELHFSNSILDEYLKNPLSLCGDDIKVDYDLAAHFTIIKNSGIVLCGLPIPEVFGDVPREDFWDSICKDIENAAEDVVYNPVGVILNLCRVYAYKIDNLVLSKENGGRWGIKNLPEKYHSLIDAMLNNYLKDTVLCRNNALESDFCEYMLNLIFYSTVQE